MSCDWGDNAGAGCSAALVPVAAVLPLQGALGAAGAAGTLGLAKGLSGCQSCDSPRGPLAKGPLHVCLPPPGTFDFLTSDRVPNNLSRSKGPLTES